MDKNLSHDLIPPNYQRKNIREILQYKHEGRDFLEKIPEAQIIKAKIDKWDYINLTSFGTPKEALNRMKRQPIGWQKIFVNYTTVKASYSESIKS